jgi:Na+-transporting NADH:ubiquinone oxidoreductase subunit C
MNKNSNTYIIIYSTVMVAIVAFALAYASLSLKPRQKANAENETKGAILLSVGEGTEQDNVPDKTAYINAEYDKYIVSSYAVNDKGDKVEGVDAFEILQNLKAEYDKPAEQRRLPVFESHGDDGKTRYVFPLWGKGLWGPIWGYLALEEDLDTVYGVVFDHQGETPGLGAEIANPPFENQFKGKTILQDGNFVSIAVLKGAGASKGNNHAVDAVSGGTITSRGVQSMLKDNLSDYEAFIKKTREGHMQPTAPEPQVTTDEANGDAPAESDIDNENTSSHE